MIELNVFDRDFVRKTIINSYVSLVWEEAYHDNGGFVLIVDDISSLQIDIGDYLFIKDNPNNTAMIVLYKELNSDTQQCTITGSTSLYLLTKRIIRNTIIVNNVEVGLYEMVMHNVRGLDRIGVAQNKGIPIVLPFQRTWAEVLTGISELGAASGIGFRMNFDRINRLHIFEVFQGADRSVNQSANQRVMFADEFKNLYNMIISDDMSNFKNVAYVAGEGEGEDRAVVEVGDFTGAERFEMFVDARDLQPTETESNTSPAYLERLRGRGKSKLAEYIRRINFTINVDPVDYGKRYYLGDIVSCKSTRYDVLLHARIKKHTHVVENNMLQTKLTVGDTKLDALGEIELWLS